jgi:hypothetical protein
MLRVLHGSKREEITGDGENCLMQSCMMCTTKYYSCGHIKVSKWAGHLAYIGEKRNEQRVLLGNLKQTDCLQGLDLDVRIILRRILGKWWESMDWFDLAQQSDKSRAFVNTVM